jgi:peroxiredoxin
MLVRLIFTLILVSLLSLQGCRNNSKEQVILNGTITNAQEKQLYIYQILPSGKPLIDSVRTDVSGNFSISFLVEKAGYYTVMVNEKNEITLVIAPGEKITLTGNGDYLQKTYKIEGSDDSKLYREYEKFTSNNLEKVDSLSRIFTESRSDPGFIAIKAQLDSAYLNIFNNQKKEVISFISKHLNSLASLLVITNNFGPNALLTEQTNPELFLNLDSTLFRMYPENSLVNTFHLRMLDFKAEMADSKANNELLKPGLTAPEINLPDQSGKETELSSLKGKLVLVYFWSSWNALSRQTNVNLTTIYNRYHESGFEIYAISIDSDTDLWRKSFLLDKAYWKQVNDAKGLESDYCKTYAVRSIPKMVLIGRDGKIISSQTEFSELDGLIKKNL